MHHLIEEAAKKSLKTLSEKILLKIMIEYNLFQYLKFSVLQIQSLKIFNTYNSALNFQFDQTDPKSIMTTLRTLT